MLFNWPQLLSSFLSSTVFAFSSSTVKVGIVGLRSLD